MTTATKKRGKQQQLLDDHKQSGDWLLVGVKANGERVLLGGEQTQELAEAKAGIFAELLELYEAIQVEKMAPERESARRGRPRKVKPARVDQPVLF